MASEPQPSPSPRTGSLDETLASIGAGVGPSEDLALERGDLIGRYMILEEVGRGAMGLVLAAYDPELDRRIALKLMPVLTSHGASKSGPGASARLLREAQAMAKLAHPNVITVHDVGTTGDEVFIAMEFIEGGSLREWLRAKQREWTEIVELFIGAGEGLAAAHRQGIVHRDFKPDNVLVREGGRACVGDFGLARRDDSVPSAAPIEDIPSGRARGLSESAELARGGLTMTGATMGTPAYMAPEQHLETTVDQRSDQFAYCVALWEALCGERPFAGSTLGAIALSVTTNERQPWPRDSPVPPRIRAAIERGLSIDPERRFADMSALLDELRVGLRRASARSRGPWLPLSITALALAGAAVAWAGFGQAEPTPTSAAPTLCSRAAEQLDGVWDEPTRATVERAFSASGLPYAARGFERAAATLDGARAAWIASHTEACEATQIYGEQSEELLDRRMSCLAQRRSELAAVAAALAVAQPSTIAGVDDLLLSVAPISSCDDLAQLEAGVAAPPVDTRARVEALRESLAQISVQRRTIPDVELLERATRLVTEAEQLDYEPVLAEALTLQGLLLEGGANPTEALTPARRAVAVATRAGHRRELAEALTLVAWLEGARRANFDIGLWLLDLAEAQSELLDRPPLLSIRIESDRASILATEGEYEAALTHFEQALALAERELGPEHVRAADLRFNIAAIRHYLDQHELAERGFREALEVYTKLTGPDHPEVAQCHNNLAAVLSARGEADEAERHAQRAMDIWTASNSTSYLPGAIANLASAAMLHEDYARALELFERAYAMKTEVFGPEHPTTIAELGAVADAKIELGRYDEAEADLHEALARLREVADGDHPDLLEMGLALVELERRRGRPREALARLDTLEVSARAAGAEGKHYVIASLILRATIELEHGRSEPAAEALARAEAQFEVGVDELLQAEARQLREQL